MTLRPGDSIEFVVTASDPEGLPIKYGISVGGGKEVWQDSGVFSIAISEKQIGLMCAITLFIKSPRKYHAKVAVDDTVDFAYQVLPSKQ
jgi:hypothetical protein